jgi:hypothetical protein
MKNYLLIVFFISCIFSSSSAQTIPSDTLLLQAMEASYWKKDFSIGINFNQASFSGNWRGGGISSVAFGGIVAGKANYLKGRVTWDNELELLYGIVNNQGEEARKQNDRIFLDSKVGYFLADHWGAFFSANFISQFAPGYDWDTPERWMISDFLSPAYLTTGAGLEYKPNQEFNLRIAPISPRFTFMRNQELYLNVPDNYGVPIGRTVRTEWLAFQLYATWDKDIAENFNIRSRYMMFANYEELEWRRIDHRFDLTLTAKITDWINVTFTSINLYDFDQDPNVQYSHALAIGLLYKIGN